MEVKDLIKIIEKDRDTKLDEVKYLKANIHNTYVLAQLDIKVIKNKEDGINVYNNILNELEKLQERIIERNKEVLDLTS